MPMRYFAIDLGDKRTGTATGDDITGIVSPGKQITVSVTEQDGNNLLAALAKAIEAFGPDKIVIGLPLNMDGSDSAQSEKTKLLGTRLQELLNIPVDYQDERLTSYAADQTMSQSGKTHKQKKLQNAASYIYLFF